MATQEKNQEGLRSGNLSVSRRNFIEKAGLATVLSSFGVAFFTSCVSSEDADPSGSTPGGGTNSSGITISGSTIAINLTIQTRLASAGGWLLIETAKTLVANISGTYVAMTSVCTHSGCFDSWSFSNNRFICNCHNSIFDTAGKVVQGPASTALQVYTTSLSGTTLTITK